MGRLLVRVPDVLGDDPCIWAVSASPLAAPGMGLYLVPPTNAGVWVEFEQGDPNAAIWTGCWRGSATEVPPLAKAAPPLTPPIVLGTQGQNSISISDVPGAAGGLLIKCRSSAFILVNDVGITINNGKGASITLLGNTVAINGTALTVT